MPSNQTVNLVAGTVSNDTCFGTVSDLYNTFINLTTAYVDGDYSLFSFGDAVPSVDDEDRPWIRTIGGVPDKIYIHYNGAWVSKHPVPSGGGERRLFTGAVADIDTYDGGLAGTATDTSGPFWERDTAMNGLLPIGIGTTANGTVISETEKTGGTDEETLIEANLPPHAHDLNYTGRGFESGTAQSGRGEGGFVAGSDTASGMVVAGPAQTSTPINNLPPYYGVYFIKRTSRIYYKA